METDSSYHVPVLLKESVDGLNIKPDGVYVDATFGGGGHSREILSRLTTGRLIAFDQDGDAAQNAKMIKESSFTFCFANFRYITRFLKVHGIKTVDGVLADLGISSHQIDTPERGFSTRYQADLDMRMDQKGKVTASVILNTYSEEQLHRIFGMYGEVRNAKTLAAEIIRVRHSAPLKTTADLGQILDRLAPKGKDFKYKAQVFQALRIEVNDEMGALEDFLESLPQIIKPGGKLVVLSYHSLEDRMVKNLMRAGNINGVQHKDFYGNLIRPFDPDFTKPIEATKTEIEKNKRARSAKLRIATKR
ncbi:MAG: 16S rRNA (cytosine(1402)-N(4))-methyltransferase RsmH [Cyclobacteriaceae bacterium]|nr:16S rRNA (cytosine(1402)-N(4))-methyltransferase RsmH [Cyclobacteriaceae bacterium]